ncbi:hypothetical protein BJX76DRAFT_359406 [Aspergillus varians]
MPPMYVSFCLYFRSALSNEIKPVLQLAVNKLVEQFPWISGEVVRREPQPPVNQIGLLCIQQPATPGDIPMIQFNYNKRLSVHEITSARSRTGNKELQLFNDLAPLPSTPDPSGPFYVVRFKATVARDGLILAMSFSHSVFDATGAAQLMRHFAESCRDTNPKPCLDDQSMRRELWTIGSAITAEPTRSEPPVRIATRWDVSSEEELAARTMVCRWKIPAIKITLLKRACNALLALRLIEDGDSPVRFLSSLDVLTACLMVATQPELGPTEGADAVGIAVNFRERLDPKWSRCYMGNLSSVFLLQEPSLPTQEDLAASRRLISDTNEITIAPTDLALIYRHAYSIRQTLSAMNDKYLRGYISDLISQHDLSQIDLPCPQLACSDWKALGLYALDFGPLLGKVDDFLTHEMPPIKIGIVLPKRETQTENSEVEPEWDVLFWLKSEDHAHVVKNELLRFLIDE